MTQDRQNAALLPEELVEAEELLREKEVFVVPGTLYVVATPIGRVVDLSVRALKVLQQVDLIAAEDTRRTYILLNILGLQKQVVSNQKFNEHQKAAFFLNSLRDGKSVAVVSDAGTPCISDPGNELVKAALGAGVPVVPVPGPCAAVSGASVSGFDLTSFLFAGFFPKDNRSRREELERLQSGCAATFVYYESPKRILDTMAYLAEKCPAARVCLCNDLTKTHERFYRGSPAEVLQELEENPKAEKGEFTLILEMPPAPVKEKEVALSPEAALVEEMTLGAPTVRDAMERLLEKEPAPYKKNELKEAALRLKKLFE